MFVFLDLEKAFDRVSWDYMQKAIEKLGFGKDFLKWVRILYDESNSPRRRLKINGHEGERFTLKCGTAQGCPLSPLLYLCVMEAFSRAVKADKKIKGIKVGRSELKLSQFADDTVLLLREFRSIKRVWDILRRIEKATGQRVNSDKTEGLLLGSLRNDARAPGWIKWCADGDYIISLGVPFGNDFEGSPQEIGFWRKIYHKTKTIMARWTAIFAQTMRGRVMIANSMVYSRFRYWTQVMMMPDDIIAWLEEDVHQLIWSKDPHFEGGQEGQQEKNKRKIKENTAKLAWKEGGIGLLVWKEHLKSLRKKWIVRYLDRERGAWKEVLDQWVLKGHTYGRGILLMGNTTPPTAPTVFWQKAIEEFQEMEVARAGRITEPSEAEEEPIWDGKEITTLRGLAHGSLWGRRAGTAPSQRLAQPWYQDPDTRVQMARMDPSEERRRSPLWGQRPDKKRPRRNKKRCAGHGGHRSERNEPNMEKRRNSSALRRRRQHGPRTTYPRKKTHDLQKSGAQHPRRGI